MKSVIMAGGLGTRLRPLTYDYPKPLMPVDGRPSIFYLLNSLSESSEEFIITSNYMYEKLLYQLTHDEIFQNFNFLFSIEKEPLGTFGGIKKVEKFLDSTFAVGNADTVFDFKIKEILDFHLKRKNIITIALTRVENPSDFGIVRLEDGIIKEFQEKPKTNPISNTANTGLYIMEPDVFDYFPKGQVADIANDLIPRLMEDNKKIGGFLTSGTWIDIGRPKDLIRANMHIAEKWKSNKIPNSENSYYNGKINFDNSSEIIDSYIYGNTTIGKNCLIKNSLILDNTTIADNSIIIDSIIGFESEILNGSRISNSVVGSRVIFRGVLENSINSRKLENI